MRNVSQVPEDQDRRRHICQQIPPSAKKKVVFDWRTIPRKFCKLMGQTGYELDDVCNACLDDECSKSNQMWKWRSYSKMSLFG
uniref:Uncharacterized protein n=1 Tax=Caenorhabditis japonica TaxID=281687 RepID=A0A8R1IRA9_CAEJA